MIADERFTGQPLEFWANVRLISQKIGYTEKVKKGGEKGSQTVKVPTVEQIAELYKILDLDSSRIINNGQHTPTGELLMQYFEHRAQCLNEEVKSNLMNVDQAREVFEQLQEELQPQCPIPLNKQKYEKSGPAYFSAIINMLIEKNTNGLPVNYDPRELTAFTHNRFPVRSLSRRVDGAFPTVINPIAIWEIKEYYYTTSFGSRIADGVYETMLDGFEFAEVRSTLNIGIKHYLMVDAYNTWWNDGKAYLCRICDMLHMELLTEVLFGKEVIERIPVIAEEWLGLYNNLYPPAEVE